MAVNRKGETAEDESIRGWMQINVHGAMFAQLNQQLGIPRIKKHVDKRREQLRKIEDQPTIMLLTSLP